MDQHSIIKASQAIASEIQLDKLLLKMVDIIMQTSSAEKCVVVLTTRKNSSNSTSTSNNNNESSPKMSPLLDRSADNNNSTVTSPSLSHQMLLQVQACKLSNDSEETANPVLQNTPIIQCTHYLCLPLITYVARVKQIVVLDNASVTGKFITVYLSIFPVYSSCGTHYLCKTIYIHIYAGNWVSDPYFQRNQTKSVLCLPLLQKGDLSGIVYLENNLFAKVFTLKRVELLQVLSSQVSHPSHRIVQF